MKITAVLTSLVVLSQLFVGLTDITNREPGFRYTCKAYPMLAWCF
ncbi:hypothetical protein [Corynebacterium uterequi]|uniref:Uncharacterized protein n=1 Tax=Corynebacterium uterequi TaxID=1072256 RepID=A0A0G3HFL5_9CORY|nr:hypothetical protein [Corynebacterium uterequi]AKK10723.1 hypothetical protein CUTER_03575 [Corynebacterium uterequi]